MINTTININTDNRMNVSFNMQVPNVLDAANDALISEQNAKVSETNAATSAGAAFTYQNAAKTSETNSKTSETNAATSATSAATSASAALSSKNAAATSATNAATSASAALSSKNAAATSETNAKTSETNAKASETSASSSKDRATVSANNAKASELSATASASSALSSKIAAAESATQALASKNAAAQSATEAGTYLDNAQQNATLAQASATSAGESLVASQAIQSSVTTMKNDVATMKNSATASELAALSYKNEANTYKANAAGSASQAQTSATAAATSATQAATSATTASTKATEAGTYATDAQTSANTAQSLLTQTQTVANTATSAVANLAPSAYLASTTYSIGQTVYHADGYTYRYINATPASNKAPTDTAYWVKVATGLYSQTDLVNSNAYLKELAKSEYVRSAVMSGVLDWAKNGVWDWSSTVKGEIQFPVPPTTQLNKFRLETTRAVINGVSVYIEEFGQAGEITNNITLPTPPTSGTRDDLVFIEGYWVSKPAGASIYKYGQTGGTVERTTTVPETVFEWRLRVVAGVNFTTYAEGLDANAVAVQAQGTNASPLNYPNGVHFNYTFYSTSARINTATAEKKVALDDYGLYVAGVGDSTKSTLGTADGYSYAIPLFRVKRRNSVGYSASNPNGGRNYVSAYVDTTVFVGKPVGTVDNVNVGTMYDGLQVGDVLLRLDGNLGFKVLSKNGSNIVTAITLNTGVTNQTYSLKSDRPDGKYSNIISADDIIDLRHKVSLTGNNYASLAELNKTALDAKLLKTNDTTTLIREALTNKRRTKSNAQISETNVLTVNPAKTQVLLPSDDNKGWWANSNTNLIPASPNPTGVSGQFNWWKVNTKDGTTFDGTTGTTAGNYLQHIFSFDLTKLGGTRDAIVNSLAKLKFGWAGRCKGDNASVADYTASISFWNGSAWETATDITTAATNIIPAELTKTATFTNYVDANGKVWMLVKSKYPASATIASELYTDVASLTVELDKWAVGRTIEVTTTEGVLSGIIDADTALAKITEYVAGDKFKVDDVSKLAVNDTFHIRTSSMDSWSANPVTITAIDTTTKQITHSHSFSAFIVGMYLVETTSSTSSPTITNSTATFSGLGTQTVTATLTAVTDATKPIAITYSTNYPANQGLTYSATAVKDVTNADCGVEIKGRTLENKLGRDGNFEVDSNADGVADGWIGDLKGATATLETTSAKYGLKAQRITSTVGDTAGTRRVEKNNININANKYYLVLVDTITDGVSARTYISVAPNTATGFTAINSQDINTSKTQYIKFTSTIAGTVYFRCFNSTSVGTVGWVQFDGARLYEIDSTIYNKIDVDPEYTGEKLAQKFPYVDSVQFKSNVLVDQKGKNLIPAFDSGEWTLHANTVVNSAYSLTLNATGGGQGSIIKINVLPNTTYKLACTASAGSDVAIVEYANDVVVGSTRHLSITSSFTTSSTTSQIRLNMYPIGSGTFTFTNPQLELGATATTFEPQQRALAHTPMQIASEESVWLMPNASVYKEVWKKNVVLDGSLVWGIGNNLSGFKQVTCPSTYGAMSNSNIIGVKHNGAILSGSTISNADAVNFYSTSIAISISNNEAGWDNLSGSPTSGEIKAYFYGWKMCDASGNTYVSGTKYWKKITDGTGITSTLPTASYAGYTPYTLHYKLATPVYHVNYYNDDQTKPIMQGTVNIPQGVTQIEQRSGVCFLEVRKPEYASTFNLYRINTTTPAAQLAYKLGSWIGLYKNGTRDLSAIQGLQAPYGKYSATILKTNYDPSAIYSVTYEQLDKYLYTVDTFSISNPTVNYAYAYQDVSNTEHNVGYFSFNTPLFTHDSANNAITISKGSVNGFADYYEYLPDQFTTPLTGTKLLTTSNGNIAKRTDGELVLQIDSNEYRLQGRILEK